MTQDALTIYLEQYGVYSSIAITYNNGTKKGVEIYPVNKISTGEIEVQEKSIDEILAMLAYKSISDEIDSGKPAEILKSSSFDARVLREALSSIEQVYKQTFVENIDPDNEDFTVHHYM